MAKKKIRSAKAEKPPIPELTISGTVIGEQGFLVDRPIPLRVLTARYVQWCADITGNDRYDLGELLGVDPKTIVRYMEMKL